MARIDAMAPAPKPRGTYKKRKAKMISPCCEMMKFYGRDHYDGVPEAELPDAIIEHRREEGRWMMDYRGEGFSMAIHHCPWCGTDLVRISN